MGLETTEVNVNRAIIAKWSECRLQLFKDHAIQAIRKAHKAHIEQKKVEQQKSSSIQDDILSLLFLLFLHFAFFG